MVYPHCMARASSGAATTLFSNGNTSNRSLPSPRRGSTGCRNSVGGTMSTSQNPAQSAAFSSYQQCGSSPTSSGGGVHQLGVPVGYGRWALTKGYSDTTSKYRNLHPGGGAA